MLQTLRRTLGRILSSVQALIESGIEISSDVMSSAATEIRRLTQGIQAAETSEQVPPTPPPEMQEAMPSSNISAFRYDDKTGRLLVQFLGEHPNRNGSVYAYEGVPKVIFDLFQRGAVPARTKGRNRWGRWWRGKNPSIGASLHTLIKTANYPYRRLS